MLLTAEIPGGVPCHRSQYATEQILVDPCGGSGPYLNVDEGRINQLQGMG